MEVIKFFFEGGPIFNVVTFLLAILSIYFAISSRKEKKPVYIVRTVNLIRDIIKKINAVEILYLGDKISNLSISEIAFWNDGKETINSNDVAPTAPIKVLIDEKYDILDAEILYRKKDANNFKYKIADDKKSIDITFDFFDYEEGIILQVFHTGNSSFDIQIDGTIKTVKKIINKENQKRSVNKKKGWKLFALGLFYMLIGIFFIIIKLFDYNLIFLFMLVAVIICGLWLILIAYLSIKRKMPKSFDIFINSTNFKKTIK